MINEIRPAAEVVQRIASQAEELLARIAERVG